MDAIRKHNRHLNLLMLEQKLHVTVGGVDIWKSISIIGQINAPKI